MKRLVALGGLVLVSLGLATPALAGPRSGSDSSGTHSYLLSCVTGEARFTNTSFALGHVGEISVVNGPFDDEDAAMVALLQPGDSIPFTWDTGWSVWDTSGSMAPFDEGMETPVEVCDGSPTAPSAPQQLTATPGDRSVHLAWSPPKFDGGGPLTDYHIYYRSTGEWTPVNPSDRSTTTNVTVTGLTNGTAYTFWVIALNNMGTGAPAEIANITPGAPATVPTFPRELKAVPGNGAVSLSWQAPSSNGGAAIDDYAVLHRLPGQTWKMTFIGVPSTLSHKVTGLTNGTKYEFRVFAVNRIGASPSALTSATPRTSPSVIRSLTATPGNRTINLTWSAPASNGGSAVGGYVVAHWNEAGKYWSVRTVTRAQSYKVTTNPNGTPLVNGIAQRFIVIPMNAAGMGPASAEVRATPRTVASAPRSLAAKARNRSVKLTWQAPASNGGAPVGRYIVQQKKGSRWATVAKPVSRVVRVTGLRNGTRYSFRVLAVNAAGQSVWSRTASAVPHR